MSRHIFEQLDTASSTATTSARLIWNLSCSCACKTDRFEGFRSFTHGYDIRHIAEQNMVAAICRKLKPPINFYFRRFP